MPVPNPRSTARPDAAGRGRRAATAAVVALLTAPLVLAACGGGGGGGRAAPRPAPVPQPSAGPTPLPPMPHVTGRLEIKVVYPTPNALVQARDSNFIFGSVGNGDATLTIDGASVPVKPNGAFGNSALTRQEKMPVPNMMVGVKAGVRRPVMSRWVPSGRSAWMSYETAPGTTLQVQVGIVSPCVALPLPSGFLSLFWNVPLFYQVRPMPFSSFARTRQ